ncbi:thiopurine S-methyltransferase [Hemicordylus capensis]|uniref:thiopurine S-methyltransferase n=1 Tax=Hemicordylus capensis TaxID=884348 RepID=UPI002303DC3A|nr:thiopurine S-methyltransferase [Hemicordylus capensis]XP_053103416.1 thiopurine S-methyltransferase [Hemicordylus capensis]XP_053103417.1 thiopurine S-methyltransferase [Hemicordylus capensis]
MENSLNSPGREDDGNAKTQKDRQVTEEEWLQKWQTNNIGFHNEEIHPLLRKYLDMLLNGRSGLKIFVPLCGKAIEMKWLADMGHHVLGVEISESALKDFFAEQNLSFTEETVPEIPGAKLFKSLSGNISLYCCSIFDLTSTVIGKCNGIWDRGSLVAVNPCDRERYANLLLSLMDRKCCCLLVTCSYDASKHKGPPFYVPDSEVNSLFGKCCDIKCLEKKDGLLERHKKWGIDYFCEIIYAIVLK